MGVKEVKKVIFGGMLFLGGAVMYSVGTLGFADVAVQASYVQVPQYLGILAMVCGIALGLSLIHI